MAENPYIWALTEHVCRYCGGRVLRRRNPDGSHSYRCADCGAEVTGHVHLLCSCGSGWAPKTRAGTWANVPLHTRCRQNPDKTDALMGEPEFVAMEED